MLTTTFALLHKHNACEGRYKHLAKSLGGIRAYGRTQPIPLLKILETNGLADTLWCLRAVLEEQAAERDRLARIFACDCAERVLPIFEKGWPDDIRPRQAIEDARRFAKGLATKDEMTAAFSAAWIVARAGSWSAWVATFSAAWVAWIAALAVSEHLLEVAPWSGEEEWQAGHLRELLEALNHVGRAARRGD